MAATKPATKGKMKPRGGNSPVIGDNGVMTNPGDNSKYAMLALEMNSWPPVDRSNIDALDERLYKYLAFCNDNDVKIGNMACYFALGIDKAIAFDWETGKYGSPAHVDFIKKVKRICALSREYLMQDGKINPITGIFWQKNHDAFADVQQFVVTPGNPLGEITDPEALKQRYLDAAPDIEAQKE